TAAAGAAAKTGMARWAGPLAAIAAGLGLGYLFSQLGAGGFLIFLLVALAGILLLAVFARRMLKPATPAPANGAPLQYQAPARTEPTAFTSGAAGATSAAAGDSGIPAGFDKAGFEQQAKKQFLALQAVNDRGDLDALRELVTDEFYNQVAKDVIQGNKEATEFDMLNAELLSIDTDRGMYWARVEFSGNVREDGVVMGSPFREVWNLNKPVDGSRGWLLAGIQQA
ncbi:MAG: Tim44 domain-containing protein, partial [Casimicrobiaceae bacterium]